MTLQEYNDLYKMPLLKSMTITTSGGITITNANIVSENMSLEKSLCSENDLRYGRCEAACFTIRIADLNHDFTGEWLNVIQDVVTDSEGYLLTQNGDYLLTEDGYRIKLKDEEIDEATAPYGSFKVYSDKPENDRRWRALTCYDQMYDILNADVLAWYNTLTFPMTIKNLRDSFFSYLGITQVSRTLVNDSFSTPGGFAVSGELSGKTVIESICELNGVFGQMTADGKFDYVSLPDAEELTFDYYVDGTGSYEDYVTDVITGINIKGTANDVGITVGTTDNLYVISSNPLVYGTEGTTALTNALTALLNKISADSFRPFKVTTYGNPMLPLGTKVTLNTKNKTIVSYVIKKNLTGIQNLKDEVSATGNKHQATNVNSPKSEIFRTQGKVHELQINVDGLTSRVAATETNLANNYSTTTQTESMISQSATDITTAVSQNYVTQSTYYAEVQTLQDQIDGRIEYYDGNVVPTLNNPPANSWTTTSAKDSHIGDLYRYHYTQSGVSKTDYYRFDKNTSTTPVTYSWVALGESEVDEALRQAELANQKADAAQAQLNALQQDVEDNYYTKAQTNSAINQSAEAITQSVSSTYETKSDSTSKFNTANTNAQGYANDAKNAANAATDNKLQSYYTKTETNSQIQQTANSITQSVSETYTTKEEFGDLQIGGTNILYLTETLATPWGKENATVTDGVATISGSGTGDKRIYQVPNTTSGWEWKPNTKYVVSIDAKALGTSTLRIIINGSGGIYKDFPLSTTWERYVYTFTTAATVTTGSITFSNRGSTNIQVKLPKLEYGDKATDWSPAPRDMASKSEIQQLSNKIALKVNSQGRIVTAALGVDPASSTSYFSVKADDISFISDGNITLATGNTGRIGIDSTNFKVNKDTGNVSVTGAITATSLTLSGSASVPSSKVSGLATVATSGKASDVSGLASVATTGSYSSLSGKPDLTVYVAKDGTIGTVEEGSTGFVVSSQGLLQASNAIIYGTIFAGSGTIGGWNIESNRILSTYISGNDTYTIRLNRYDDSVGTDKNAIEIRTVVGGTQTYPFAVKYDGRLIARQATIEGTVTSANLTATGGTVGGWSMTTNRLYGGDATKGLAIIDVPTGNLSTLSNWTFATGGTSLTSLNNARFRVASNGNAYMRNCVITANSGGTTYLDTSNSTTIGPCDVAGYKDGSLKFALNSQGNIFANNDLRVMGTFYCAGTKSRVAKTANYGNKALYCYETPTPMFGDVGEGKIAEDGKCYIWLDSTFSETIKTESYQVFLQKYGQGECYISERTSRYFIVEGTEGMSFGWEIKAKQKGYENLRLDSVYSENKVFGDTPDYATDAVNHLLQINGEREVA